LQGIRDVQSELQFQGTHLWFDAWQKLKVLGKWSFWPVAAQKVACHIAMLALFRFPSHR
jgi:hypothetical protein